MMAQRGQLRAGALSSRSLGTMTASQTRQPKSASGGVIVCLPAGPSTIGCRPWPSVILSCLADSGPRAAGGCPLNEGQPKRW